MKNAPNGVKYVWDKEKENNRIIGIPKRVNTNPISAIQVRLVVF